MEAAATPVLLIGAGNMGGAMVQGWMRKRVFAPPSLWVRDPVPGAAAQAAIACGAVANPPDDALHVAATIVFAVKPQAWRGAAAAYAPWLSPGAVVLSVVAGVRLAQLAAAFPAQRVARVMPVTAVATGAGVATLVSADDEALARAHALFDAIATTVVLQDEAGMDPATAISGSSAAYLYAFVEALEAAGAATGLPEETARVLARSTIAGAAALMAESGEDPAELRRQVTSPNGVTQAALEVLMSPEGFGPLLQRAVQAAVVRSRELGS